jgi:hypothetical protein
MRVLTPFKSEIQCSQIYHLLHPFVRFTDVEIGRGVRDATSNEPPKRTIYRARRMIYGIKLLINDGIILTKGISLGDDGLVAMVKGIGGRMRTEIQLRLTKIKKVSTVLRIICKLLMVAISLVGLACVVCVTLGVGAVVYDNIAFRTAGLSIAHRLVLGAITGLAFAALVKCFFHLHQLFGDYAHGEIFTRASVGQLRQFGIACLFWGLMDILWGVSLALSVHPRASLHGTSDSLVIGPTLIVIAWFMDMAVDIREENELTI